MLPQPLPAVLQDFGQGAEEILILGVIDKRTVVFVGSDGHLHYSDEEWSRIRTDWRYDEETESWSQIESAAPPIASNET